MKDVRGIRQEVAEEVPTISDEFSKDALSMLRKRWSDIEADFVDDPKTAVENADHLVHETARRLTETFARERENLDAMCARGDQMSVEDLRMALQCYRSFFNRLLFNVAIVRKRSPR